MLVLVGGYPKGHDKPFHHTTVSGRILRGMTENLAVDCKFVDLWETEAEEKAGKISKAKIDELRHYKEDLKWNIVALGRHVQDRLRRQLHVYFYILPHPASRRREDLKLLEYGLKTLTLRIYLKQTQGNFLCPYCGVVNGWYQWPCVGEGDYVRCPKCRHEFLVGDLPYSYFQRVRKELVSPDAGPIDFLGEMRVIHPYVKPEHRI